MVVGTSIPCWPCGRRGRGPGDLHRDLAQCGPLRRPGRGGVDVHHHDRPAAADRSLSQAKRTIDTTPVDEQQIVFSAEQPDHVEMREEADRAREAMRQLRPEERQVLELSVDRGMSQSQIAEFTELPLGTVKTHARRGMLRLRQLLEMTPVASTHGETS